jgi:alginate O-acetyltransferase complex protein AlgI
VTFTSLTFIVFLTVVFLAYWTLRKWQHQNLLLLVVSYFFYSWWDWRFCGLMLLTSLIDYTVGLSIHRNDNETRRKRLLILSVVCNLGVLGIFKYLNFFTENLIVAAQSIGWTLDFVTVKIILPAGISFYTFQAMSYTIDVYRRNIVPTKHLVEYLAFMSFFPQLVAGPIMRAAQLLPQFMRERTFSYPIAVGGCRQILWGFFKKLALADNLAPIVNAAYAEPETVGGPRLAIATICFAFQIYCDFSAYSDIANGTAKLFGFDLTRNFAYPYFSENMTEFWRRWHISLSSWFRDYVYIPLGGGRGSANARTKNVMITFLLSGLWHGASWNFVAWGAINGLAVLPRSLFFTHDGASEQPGRAALNPARAMKTAARIAVTFSITCGAWVFFRAATLGDALTIFKRMATEIPQTAPNEYAAVVRSLQSPITIRALVCLLLVLVVADWVHRAGDEALALDRWPRVVRWSAYSGLLWTSMYWGMRNNSTFIYFQF